ncbi:hypothetical protein NG799_15405 [Laspinema sp. D1]|uniref:ApeA N-terminal domain-containing protein n=1 Tax=Laspinema palackyanum D2a TaxID=2953684 RepID=A0ABT2MSS9_9CYAN|nr:hypothetical protein [Laspinema sp. D2a]
MSIDVDRNRLSQNKMFEWLRDTPQLTDMVTVNLWDTQGNQNYNIYCALIPSNQVESALSNPSWDFLPDQGMPCAVKHHENGKECVEYLRYGIANGIEPLIIVREFYGLRDDYHEISEEFRLFHRLYHDKKADKYIKIDDNGDEEVVVLVESNCIKIRLKEICQFLAIKEMYLSIQFDFKEFSKYSLEELEIQKSGSDHRENLICWGHYYGNLNSGSKYQAFSRLFGVRLFPPLPKSKSGFWGFAEEQQKEEIKFIIGINENGDEILANRYDTDYYCTPVHFRKQVLDKYYQQPSKYSVEDSILRCGNLWNLYIDNHHDDKVCVWLGDLGRDLSYKEQLHWRTHNILPQGSVSETYFKRQILAEATDSERPEHIFKQRYHDLKKSCDKYLGWQLLLPLDSDDKHNFQSLRVPATDEQRDFDELVQGLTKILIDSLNEKQLNKLISSEQRDNNPGSINRLQIAFTECGVQDTADHINFLRKLQNLRSSSAAHRKGSNYRKIAEHFDCENQSLRVVFTQILCQALDILNYFIGIVDSGQISKS